MKISFLAVALTLMTSNAFAVSANCEREALEAAEALAKITTPGLLIDLNTSRAAHIGQKRAPAPLKGVKHSYSILLEGAPAKKGSYYIDIVKAGNTCDVISVERSLDGSVG